MSALLLDAGATPQRFRFLKQFLREQGLGSWWNLSAQCWENPQHGDTARWHEAVRAMPSQITPHIELDAGCITIGDAGELTPREHTRLRQSLETLMPWRKGPFCLFGTEIDAEWRCDMKWQRLHPHIADLRGRRVLDIGCGNGYFLLRMLGAGAALALGVESSWLSHWQFATVMRTMATEYPGWMIPARFETLPQGTFDSVFSMGVLHHQRTPQTHLQQLRQRLESGGELVFETLLVDDAPGGQLDIPDRYAAMRNVYLLWTPQRIEEELRAAGFRMVRQVDQTRTTVAEQRRTRWMTNHSLADALDARDTNRTIEGYPAPARGIFIAEA